MVGRYGYNIEIGENFFANHNTVILDGGKVTFGDNVFIAPNCGFYTAGHPIDAERRNKGLEYAYPITVGSNVWIGVLQTKVNRKNEKSSAKFTRPKKGITKQAGEESHRQPG